MSKDFLFRMNSKYGADNLPKWVQSLIDGRPGSTDYWHWIRDAAIDIYREFEPNAILASSSTFGVDIVKKVMSMITLYNPILEYMDSPILSNLSGGYVDLYTLEQ